MIGYCYHSVRVITFSLTQSDHIKRVMYCAVVTVEAMYVMK